MTALSGTETSPQHHGVGRGRRARAVPPGHEAMARPWRLAIAFVGVTVGLLARLLVANGLSEITADPLVLAAAATSAIVGLGLTALAAERDRLGPSGLVLVLACGLALGAQQWISPDFADGALEWNDDGQLALAALGFGNGLLLGGIVSLAFVRRASTPSVVASLAAGVLVLVANTTFLRQQWPAIMATAVAFGVLLLAWDRAPRHEPVFRPGSDAPRIARAILSLATGATAGAALLIWSSQGQDDVGRPMPAVATALAMVAVALLGLTRLRRGIRQRRMTQPEWAAWMREMRGDDPQSELGQIGGTRGAPGDRTADLPRPLSFPDLRVGEEPDVAESLPLDTPPLDTPPVDTPPVDTAPLDTPPPDTAPAPPVVAPEERTPPEPVFVLLRREPEAAPQPPDPVFATLSKATESSPGATVQDLALWLADHDGRNRLVLAVEAMSLDDYDLLPPEVSGATTSALVEAIADRKPGPAVIAPVDGPYLLAGFDDADMATMTALHREVGRMVRQPIETIQGTVGLTGAVAIVRPAGGSSLDDVIDAAIAGLIQAHRARVGSGAR